MISLQEPNNKDILIVDDEADVLDFLKIYLESLEWRVTVAPSSVEAFNALKEKMFFLLITDIAMPDMDGYEFITKIIEKGYTGKVALMTGFGYNPKHTLVKLNKSLHYPCLFKPFNRGKVAEVVQEAWNTYHNDSTPEIRST